MAVEDFYASHKNYRTRLVLHVRDSRGNNFQAASAGTCSMFSLWMPPPSGGDVVGARGYELRAATEGFRTPNQKGSELPLVQSRLTTAMNRVSEGGGGRNGWPTC
jgi:hypothetical protein